MWLLKDLVAAIEQNSIQSIERREIIMAQGFIRKGMIWKNPVAVNPENSRENNLIDCSGLLKYHSEVPLGGCPTTCIFVSKWGMERRHDRHSRFRLRGGKLRRESRKASKYWIPAFAGMTEELLSPPVSIEEVVLKGVVGESHRGDLKCQLDRVS